MDSGDVFGSIFAALIISVFVAVIAGGIFASIVNSVGKVRALSRGRGARGLILTTAMTATRWPEKEGQTTPQYRGERRQVTMDVQVVGKATYVVSGTVSMLQPGLVAIVPGTSLDLAVDPSNPLRIFVMGPGGFTGDWLSITGTSYLGTVDSASMTNVMGGAGSGRGCLAWFFGWVGLFILILVGMLTRSCRASESHIHTHEKTGEHERGPTTKTNAKTAAITTKVTSKKIADLTQPKKELRVTVQTSGIALAPQRDKVNASLFDATSALFQCFSRARDIDPLVVDGSVSYDVTNLGPKSTNVVDATDATSLVKLRSVVADCTSRTLRSLTFPLTAKFRAVIAFESNQPTQIAWADGRASQPLPTVVASDDVWVAKIDASIGAISASQIFGCYPDRGAGSYELVVLAIVISAAGKVQEVHAQYESSSDSNVKDCLTKIYPPVAKTPLAVRNS